MYVLYRMGTVFYVGIPNHINEIVAQLLLCDWRYFKIKQHKKQLNIKREPIFINYNKRYISFILKSVFCA